MSNSNEDLKAGINFLCRSLPKWGLLILKQGTDTDKQNYVLIGQCAFSNNSEEAACFGGQDPWPLTD